ncbi:hypothetical protein STW0522CIT19_00700 [Citrobacter freundii]|nr:hypothetical protein STW0522CIT01_00700 [Citrobacter freundii]BBV33595.1 hypothetical protein STW0522CIT19_00700 [Citrobacter freundii]
MGRHRSGLASCSIPGEMLPGCVDPVYFRLLMTMAQSRSPAMMQALEAVLVKGMSRKEACLISGVSESNLSVKISRLQEMSRTIARMYSCQFNRADCPVSKHMLIKEKETECGGNAIPDGGDRVGKRDCLE